MLKQVQHDTIFMISLIVAMSKNNVIGNEGKIPWKIKGEQKRFKEITMGHPMIMGRKTFESIGRALPGRTSIILTRDPNFFIEGTVSVNSIEEAVEQAKVSKGSNEIFVIGGEQIYKEFLDRNLVDKIYMTLIYKEVNGIAFFPEINWDVWNVTKFEEKLTEEGDKYEFLLLERK